MERRLVLLFEFLLFHRERIFITFFYNSIFSLLSQTKICISNVFPSLSFTPFIFLPFHVHGFCFISSTLIRSSGMWGGAGDYVKVWFKGWVEGEERIQAKIAIKIYRTFPPYTDRIPYYRENILQHSIRSRSIPGSLAHIYMYILCTFVYNVHYTLLWILNTYIYVECIYL